MYRNASCIHQLIQYLIHVADFWLPVSPTSVNRDKDIFLLCGHDLDRENGTGTLPMLQRLEEANIWRKLPFVGVGISSTPPCEPMHCAKI